MDYVWYNIDNICTQKIFENFQNYNIESYTVQLINIPPKYPNISLILLNFKTYRVRYWLLGYKCVKLSIIDIDLTMITVWYL